MTEVATRRLTDINFEHEGAHVALVHTGQGGPANGITTMITKATHDIDPAQVALATAGQNSDQPLETIKEPLVDQIEKSVHEQLLAQAVVAAVDVEKAVTANVQKQLDDATAELAVFKAAAATARADARKADLLAAKVPADSVEATLKSLEALSDESFAGMVATMKALAAAADASDLMQETGVSGVGAETQAEVDHTTALLEKRYGKASAK